MSANVQNIEHEMINEDSEKFNFEAYCYIYWNIPAI